MAVVFLCKYTLYFMHMYQQGYEGHFLQLHLHPGATHLTYVCTALSSQELNVLRPKAGFRLWLTAEVHPRFPPILLQSSLKITYEVHTKTCDAYRHKKNSTALRVGDVCFTA